MKKGEVQLLDEQKRRHDGRAPNETRPISMKVGVLDRADGSALVEFGKTKVLAAVYGPREVHPRHLALPDRALLRVSYRMATFSTWERKRPTPSRREIELSMVIASALEPALFLEKYPKCAIDVFCLVIEADGGTRTTAINAASLALADAGIPMRGLVVAIAVGRVGDTIIVDLDEVEDNYAESDMPIAMLFPQEEITLLQMDGTMSPHLFEQALETARQVLRNVYSLQVKALKERALKARTKVVL